MTAITKTWLQKTIGWLWAVVAATTVMGAVMVTVVRLMLPQIDDYRLDIEHWVTNYMDQPVVIEKIGADWLGWHPNLRLTNIELLDQTRKRSLTLFSRADIEIDVLASVLQRRLVPGRLTVSGVQLSLLRGADGAIRIEGVAPENPQVPSVRQNALAYWLQNQSNLAIESANITWHDQESLLKPMIFSDVSLVIQSDGERRQLQGSARLPEDTGKKFNFRIDIAGDLLTPKWSGDIFIEGQAINPSLLLNYRQWMGLKLAHGKVDFKLWSRWENAKLVTLSGDIAASSVRIGVEDYGFELVQASAIVSAAREDVSRWSLALDQLNVTTHNGHWPQSKLALAITTNQDDSLSLVANSSFLRLDDVAPLIPNIPAIPADIRNSVARIKPRGDLRDVRVSFFPDRPANERFYLRTEFTDISTQSFGTIPGITNFQGTIKANALGGELIMAAPDLQIHLDDKLDEPIHLQNLAGSTEWREEDGSWTIATAGLEVVHPLIDAKLSGTVTWAPGQAPVANLGARINGGELEHLRAVVPKGVMPTKGYNWLRTALPGGTITSGGAVLRGPLDKFPFDQREGVFKFRLVVAEALLDFLPTWPRVEEVEAEISMEGRQLSSRIASGKMMKLELRDIDLVMADLFSKKRVLNVHGFLTGSAANGLRVVNSSPLKKSIGKRLEDFDISGPMKLDLSMHLPLYPGGKPLRKYNGVLSMTENTVIASRLRMTLEQFTGDVRFTRGAWDAEGIEAYLHGYPVQLGFTGKTNAPKDSPNRYRLTGWADREMIRRQAEILAPTSAAWLAEHGVFEHITGDAAWEAILSVPNPNEDNQVQQHLHVISDLDGLGIDLPYPIGKTPAGMKTFVIDAEVSRNGVNTLEYAYGDEIYTKLETLKHADGSKELIGAVVRFGGELAEPLPDSPVWVGGQLAALSPGKWYQALNLGATAPTLKPALATVFDLQISQLEALGQTLSDVSLKARSDTSDWKVTLAGPTASGNIDIPFAISATPIQIEFDTLRFSGGNTDNLATPVDPSKIPALTVSVDEFYFNDIPMGHMELKTKPLVDGLTLDELSFVSPKFEITASGDWKSQQQEHTSDFNIEVASKDFGALLGNFGYDATSIEGGATKLEIEASWSGSPTNFALEHLNGKLRLRVAEGRLLDVKPGAGRLFGLLSIQSLPRRLTLDFNDLFKKGFSFDQIEGAFDLDHGDAYTNNLAMDGPSARVEITGRTGLANQDYDQLVTVTPQFADSLPVASALFGPAGAGVGAVLFLGGKVFKSIPDSIDKMLARKYSVTGDWNEPIIEQLKMKRASG